MPQNISRMFIANACRKIKNSKYDRLYSLTLHTVAMLSEMKPEGSLEDLLRCASDSTSSRGMIFYALGNSDTPWKQVAYADLHAEAAAKSAIIQHIKNFKKGAPVFLHLQDHWDTILWFWSVVHAGGLP